MSVQYNEQTCKLFTRVKALVNNSLQGKTPECLANSWKSLPTTSPTTKYIEYINSIYDTRCMCAVSADEWVAIANTKICYSAFTIYYKKIYFFMQTLLWYSL